MHEISHPHSDNLNSLSPPLNTTKPRTDIHIIFKRARFTSACTHLSCNVEFTKFYPVWSTYIQKEQGHTQKVCWWNIILL